jgi:hypothetical protein
LDSGFLALALGFVLIGSAGIVLFNGPLTPSGDSCYCIIPSPEPGAAQGTSSIFLVLGVLFFPIGVLKGGPPSFGRRGVVKPAPMTPGGAVFTPLPISSGSMFGLGVVMIILGLDFFLIPGFLFLHNLVFELGGAALIGMGLLLLFRGAESTRSKS